jgi:hypothetical protein
MSKRIVLLGGSLVIMLVLAACGGQPARNAAPAKTPDAMMENTPDAMRQATPDAMMASTPDAMMGSTPDAMLQATPSAMMATPEAMMSAPTWFSASLTNSATGDNFMIQDFTGKVVLVETMAMWCPTCLRQGKEVKALHDRLDPGHDLVSVSVDIDLNEKLADLKGYAAKNGFDWIYTAASPDVAREIGDLYGQQFLSPTAAPMLIIDRHGEVHLLPFGVKSAADLQKMLEPFLNEAM